MFFDVAAVVGYGAGRAVVVDDVVVSDRTAVAEGTFAFDEVWPPSAYPVIVKAEVGAGTEVAVELFHIMALGSCFIERAESRLRFYHIVKIKIVDDGTLL